MIVSLCLTGIFFVESRITDGESDGVADKSLSKPLGSGESYGKLQKSEAETEEGRAFNIAGRHSGFRSSLLLATSSIFRSTLVPWFFSLLLRSSCRNCDFDLSPKYDCPICFRLYKIALLKLCIDLFINYGKILNYSVLMTSIEKCKYFCHYNIILRNCKNKQILFLVFAIILYKIKFVLYFVYL